MSILSGFKKYKDYILTSNGYQLSSRWTKSDAVVMGDGTDDTNTLEKNLGSIQGITDSLTATSPNIALSAKGANDMYNELNSNLNSLEENISANKYDISDNIDLSNYNSQSNMYVIPKDGYITIATRDGAIGEITLVSSNDVPIIAISAVGTVYTTSNSVFVKKGMKCYCTVQSGVNVWASFRPLK